MIIAPYVFDIDENGLYTTDVVTDWVQVHGNPYALHTGRMLHFDPDTGWRATTAKSLSGEPKWKPIDEAAKTVKEAFAEAEVPADPRPGYYELLDPEQSVFALEAPPRTSLYALQKWVPAQKVPGILWAWDDAESAGPRYAVVRSTHLTA